MKNSIVIFFVSLVVSFSGFAKSDTKENLNDDRILVKLPFKDRNHVLSGMRNYLQNVGEMINAVSEKNFNKVEEVAMTMILTEKKLKNLSKRENEQFIKLAAEFHSNGVVDIISAARLKDTNKTLKSISSFVNRCNSCHKSYRLLEWPEKDYPDPPVKKVVVPADYNITKWGKKNKK